MPVAGDAFASDCSSWKTYKELGCTINKEESTYVNGKKNISSDEPNSALEKGSHPVRWLFFHT